MSNPEHPWLPDDHHPDPLVESLEYPRPHPGWYGVRAWHVVPMALKVQFHSPVIGPMDPPPPFTTLTGTFMHPSLDYVKEVSRQLLSGERRAFLLMIDAPQVLHRLPWYTEIAWWDHVPGIARGPWASGRTTYAWDGDDVCAVPLAVEPVDIAAIDWRPAPPQIIR